MKEVVLVFQDEAEVQKQKQAEYNKKYREKHSAIISCQCGVDYKMISKYTHIKSSKHLEYLAKKNGIDIYTTG